MITQPGAEKPAPQEEDYGENEARAGGPEVSGPARNGLEVSKEEGSPPAVSPFRAINLANLSRLAVIVLSGMVILYVGRPVMMPVVFSVIAGMALKPLIRWLERCHFPPALGAAIVLGVFVGLVSFGVARLAAPAMDWINEAPENMSLLRQRVHRIFRPAAKISEAAAAVNNLGNPEQDKSRAVQVRDGPGTASVINWTGGLLGGLVETLVLLFLLLASGDLFLQKVVSVSPTFQDKRRAVEISKEIQQLVSHYLFTVSLINITFGLVIGIGLYFLGVPNPAMWGAFAAILNYVPYFGPFTGIIVLAILGLLTFDTLPKGILPPLWYGLVHGLESNFITPYLLGRRFTISPVIIFVSLIFWMWIWGVVGALLSVPILVAVKVVCDHVPALAPVSEFLLAHPPEPSEPAKS